MQHRVDSDGMAFFIVDGRRRATDCESAATARRVAGRGQRQQGGLTTPSAELDLSDEAPNKAGPQAQRSIVRRAAGTIRAAGKFDAHSEPGKGVR